MSKETVEEAADKWGRHNYPLVDIPRKGVTPFGSIAFKKGAEWQKEQSGTEAIEFAIWTHKNLWANINDEPLWYNKNKVYQDKTECLTSQQLYELWKKSK